MIALETGPCEFSLTHTRMHVRTVAHTHSCSLAHANSFTRPYTQACTHVSCVRSREHTQPRTHAYLRNRTHTRAHDICTYTFLHLCMHTHEHINYQMVLLLHTFCLWNLQWIVLAELLRCIQCNIFRAEPLIATASPLE